MSNEQRDSRIRRAEQLFQRAAKLIQEAHRELQPIASSDEFENYFEAVARILKNKSGVKIAAK